LKSSAIFNSNSNLNPKLVKRELLISPPTIGSTLAAHRAGTKQVLEDRRVRADAKRQRKHRDRREARMLQSAARHRWCLEDKVPILICPYGERGSLGARSLRLGAFCALRDLDPPQRHPRRETKQCANAPETADH
jgi:hypothetical protein